MEKIAEMMVRRQFERQGKFLPAKFWNLPEYKTIYQHQCRMAAKLIRVYGIEVIMAVLEREKWCFSLAAKTLPRLFDLEQHKRKIQTEAKEMLNNIEPEQIIADVPLFRQPKRKTFADGEEETAN